MIDRFFEGYMWSKLSPEIQKNKFSHDPPPWLKLIFANKEISFALSQRQTPQLGCVLVSLGFPLGSWSRWHFSLLWCRSMCAYDQDVAGDRAMGVCQNVTSLQIGVCPKGFLRGKTIDLSSNKVPCLAWDSVGDFDGWRDVPLIVDHWPRWLCREAVRSRHSGPKYEGVKETPCH